MVPLMAKATVKAILGPKKSSFESLKWPHFVIFKDWFHNVWRNEMGLVYRFSSIYKCLSFLFSPLCFTFSLFRCWHGRLGWALVLQNCGILTIMIMQAYGGRKGANLCPATEETDSKCWHKVLLTYSSYTSSFTLQNIAECLLPSPMNVNGTSWE
jgi:hypothetical protein